MSSQTTEAPGSTSDNLQVRLKLEFANRIFGSVSAAGPVGFAITPWILYCYPPFFLDDWTQGWAEPPRYGAYWNAKQPLPRVVRKGSLNKA